MTRRRIICLFISMALLFSACTPVDLQQKEQTDAEFTGMNAEPDLSYEIPVSTPHILVDQLGYSARGEKTAILKGTKLPETFEVIDAESGEVVFTGTVKEKEDTAENLSGYADFSELTEEGTYYVQSSVLGRSYEFQISETMYESLFANSVKKLSVVQNKKINVLLPEEGAGEKILQGGWFTDSEGNQDLQIVAKTATVLLMAYELYPTSFTEKGASAQEEPELLQYIRKQTEWMQLLQDEKTGGVYGGILVDTKKNSTAYRMKEMSYEASACFAAMMAKFSYTYKKYDQEYAAQCLRAADRAWKYINKQPTQIVEAQEKSEELSTMLFAAAAELYRASGQGSYHLAVKRFMDAGVEPGVSVWDTCGSVTYLSTRHSVNVEYCTAVMKQLMSYAEEISADARGQVYLTSGKADFSNTKELLWNMVILSVADYVITNHEYATVIESHQHFFGGCNPTGVCLVQEEGCDSVWTGGEGIQENLLTNAYYICMLSQILNQKEE